MTQADSLLYYPIPGFAEHACETCGEPLGESLVAMRHRATGTWLRWSGHGSSSCSFHHRSCVPADHRLEPVPSY